MCHKHQDVKVKLSQIIVWNYIKLLRAVTLEPVYCNPSRAFNVRYLKNVFTSSNTTTPWVSKAEQWIEPRSPSLSLHHTEYFILLNTVAYLLLIMDVLMLSTMIFLYCLATCANIEAQMQNLVTFLLCSAVKTEVFLCNSGNTGSMPWSSFLL